MMTCPCGTQAEYSTCCEPLIEGKRHASSAEMLMRSRYTAYVKGAMRYLRETLAPESQSDFNEKESREWAQNSEWLGLEMGSVKGDTVEFTAKYKTDGKVLEHHEVARFRKQGDRWFFVDGESHVHEEGQGHHHHEPMVPIVRGAPKIGRNDPCSCGSGKKFKKCCGV